MCTSWVNTNLTRTGALVAFAVGVALFMQSATAQQQPAPSPAPSAPQQAAPPEQPGMFESIGRWFDQGAANFRQSMQTTKQKFDEIGSNAAQTGKTIGDKASDVGKGAADVGKGAADATKGAVEAIVKLPNARVISGRESCAVAANGAPDCQAAAETLCRKQGFGTGKSMDFTSAEQCPARVWISGRQGDEQCTTVTFISRAMCQ